MTTTMTMKGNTNLSFGQAIELLKEGKMVTRQEWNGKGLFVFMQIPSRINMEIVPKMQSLPQSVKDEFDCRWKNAVNLGPTDLDPIYFNSITYSNQLALVNPNNMITGWSPSTSDSLAEDWIEVITKK